MQKESNRFQILSLSGGGYRGLYTVSVLSHLEKDNKYPIARHFDLLAGTSIGGIIALAIALEVPANVILQAFERNGEKIFPSSALIIMKGCKFFKNLLFPKYRAEALKETIIEIVGQSTLVGDLLHPVIIPTVNVTKGAPQFFKTPHHENFKMDWRIPVWKVALATSAAPTYFPLAQIDDAYYTDGGLYANSPDFAALHEAQHFLGITEIERIHLLTVGTTQTPAAFSTSIGTNLGRVKWIKKSRLWSLLGASQEKYSAYMLGHKLGNRFKCINETPSPEQLEDIGLDIAGKNAQQTLKALGRISAQRALGESDTKDFFKHLAAERTFHYGSRASAGGK